MFLFLLFNFLLFGQIKEMVITEVPTPTEFPPIFRSHPDDAAIIIQSTITQLQFDSNTLGITDVHEEEGKITIFLKPETQIITIKNKAYMEGKLPTMYLKSKQVKYFKIDEKGFLIGDIPINIITDPAEVKIYLDGKFLGIKPQQKIPAGVHLLKLEKEGYKTVEKSIEISESNTLFNVSLELIEDIPITISTNPDAALIYVDNIPKGETPKGIFLMPGKYHLKLTKSAYLDKEQEIEITEKGNNIFAFNLTANNGELELKLSPSDCNIYINHEKKDFQSVFKLAPGIYKLQISKEGFYTKEEIIDIELGKRISKTISLESKVGNLKFSVTPPYAAVELTKDDSLIDNWKGLKVIKNLQIGNYKINCNYDGYSPIDENLTINENKTTITEIVLKKNELDSNIQEGYVEEMPTFPGGEDAFYYYVGKQIQYPEIAKRNGVEGRVYIQFVVRTDGKITDVTVAKGIGAGCDEEAVRVVRSMPKWKPGTQNGHPVNIRISIPIDYKLQ